MEKRRIIFGTYDTAAHGSWTLSSWALSAATRVEHLVEVPGRHGVLDLSTVLTDGEPVYSARVLTATLESSEGTRLSREEIIEEMVNELDGMTMEITLPDAPLRYITGVVHVEKQYNDPAHASVIVTATCQPWRYNKDETLVHLTADSLEQTAELVNAGRLAVIPTLEVTGESVRIVYGSSSWALSAGTYALPDLKLTRGVHKITYSGSGSVRIAYREAVL